MEGLSSALSDGTRESNFVGLDSGVQAALKLISRENLFRDQLYFFHYFPQTHILELRVNCKLREKLDLRVLKY